MYNDYPKVVRISVKAYNILLKVKTKRGLSMAKILSEYIVQNEENDNSFFNWFSKLEKSKKSDLR